MLSRAFMRDYIAGKPEFYPPAFPAKQIYNMPANPLTILPTTALASACACRITGTFWPKKPVVDWFEIISENFMVDGGRPLEVLDQILEQYRVVQHGVAMYFGSADRLNREHLKKLKRLVKRTNTPWLSDHLCWGSVDGRYTHDLVADALHFCGSPCHGRKHSRSATIFSKCRSAWKTSAVTRNFMPPK